MEAAALVVISTVDHMDEPWDCLGGRRLAPSSRAYRSAVHAEKVVDELYALPPEQFTAGLRKPTVLAWLPPDSRIGSGRSRLPPAAPART
jgi:hypothetical protein